MNDLADSGKVVRMTQMNANKFQPGDRVQTAAHAPGSERFDTGTVRPAMSDPRAITVRWDRRAVVVEENPGDVEPCAVATTACEGNCGRHVPNTQRPARANVCEPCAAQGKPCRHDFDEANQCRKCAGALV